MAIYPNHNVPPLQPYFKYLKTMSILQELITVLLNSMIIRVCKTKDNDHLIKRMIVRFGNKNTKCLTVHTADCTLIPGRQNVCFVSYQGALSKQTSIK